MPILTAGITQRVVFAEAVASGQAVHEIDESGPAVKEIEALTIELMEYANDQ